MPLCCICAITRQGIVLPGCRLSDIPRSLRCYSRTRGNRTQPLSRNILATMRFRGRTHRSGLRLLLVGLINRLSRGLHLSSLSTLFAYAVNSLRRAKRTFDGFWICWPALWVSVLARLACCLATARLPLAGFLRTKLTMRCIGIARSISSLISHTLFGVIG